MFELSLKRGTMAKLKRKKIGLAVLANKTNLGPKASEVQFVLLILSPKREVSFCESFNLKHLNLKLKLRSKTLNRLFTSHLPSKESD